MTARPLALLLLVVGLGAEGPPQTLVVRHDGPTARGVAVLAEIDPSIRPGDYLLTAPPTGETAATATAWVEGDKIRFAAVFKTLETGEHRYALNASTTAEGGMTLTADGPSRIKVAVGRRPFTEARADLGPKPILYPLVGPTGAAMTRAYPMADVKGEDRDHPHHRSLWFTHGLVNGVDFWSELPGHGAIKQRPDPATSTGLAVATLRTVDDWIGPDGTIIAEDERVLRFYPNHSLDFEITLKATRGPIKLGDTKEGTLGLRVASSMDVTRKLGGSITNAEGLKDQATWGKASAWVDYRGPIDGKIVGVTIMDHPASFRHPTTWHVRDYGLFAANPFGYHDFGRQERGDHTIPAGGSSTFRYRIMLHDGSPTAEDLAAAYSAFARPPRIALVGE